MAESLASLLKKSRLKRKLTQTQVGAVLGVSRQRLGQIESGRDSLWVEPERAKKLCSLLEIDMLDLCLAMGYPIKIPGTLRPEDALLLKAFHQAAPSVQDHIRRGLEAST